MSATYIQLHFRLDFFMKANNMNPNSREQSDQVPYCLNIGYHKTHAEVMADDKSCDWRGKWLWMDIYVEYLRKSSQSFMQLLAKSSKKNKLNNRRKIMLKKI